MVKVVFTVVFLTNIMENCAGKGPQHQDSVNSCKALKTAGTKQKVANIFCEWFKKKMKLLYKFNSILLKTTKPS